MDLIITGGPLFMVPLILIGVTALFLAVYFCMNIVKGRYVSISWVKHLGVLALGLGALGQSIGLYGAFLAIEEWGGVSPKILLGGIRVSSITTITGLTVFVIAYILWFLLKLVMERKGVTSD